MAYCHQRDFMFCHLCGTMLSFNSPRYAQCPLCKYKRSIKGIAGIEICNVITAKDIRRDLGIPSFEQDDEELQTKLIDHNVKCRNCPHQGLTYIAKQTRSADEGQTLFYECPACGHSYKENT